MHDPTHRLSFNVLIEAFTKLCTSNKKYQYQNKRDLGATVMTVKEDDGAAQFAEFVPVSSTSVPFLFLVCLFWPPDGFDQGATF
jgi:hypothetical protein